MQVHDRKQKASCCFSEFQKCAGEFLREYRSTVCFGLLYGAILYSLMMIHQLTNTFDGLWIQNYYLSDVAELSSGRWLLGYIDQFFRGIHADPITTMIALALYILAFVFVLDLFRLKDKTGCWLCLAMFLSSTTISCTLSYRFTSVAYGLACFLAVLSFYSMIKCRNHVLAVVIGGVCLGLSMACYQAYLAVFCTVALFYVLFCCKDAQPFAAGKGFGCFVLRILCGLGFAAIFYKLSLSLCLKLQNATLSSYNGVNQVSIGSLLANLPRSIVKIYRYFYAYFFMDKLKINTLQPSGVFYALLALLAGLLIYFALKAWRTEKKRLLLLLPAAAAIPVARNAYMLLAGDKLELQMTAALALVAPLTLVLAFVCFAQKGVVKLVCACLCAVLVYGGAVQVWTDQEAMYEGQNACDTMMTQVLSDLSREALLSTDYEYLFIGVPRDNPHFSVSSTYDSANAYAQLGRFWVNDGCGQASYDGLFNRRLGFTLPVSWMPYEKASDQMNLEEMPVFPTDGYIALLDGKTVVVKISEYRSYSGDSKYSFD